MERNEARRFGGLTGDETMPRYFFHLSFGQRVVLDEEGFELPNRLAARNEALAVVRDLANPDVGSNAKRWASWFLEVADDEDPFFRTPIGHPALEIVTAHAQELKGNAQELGGEEREVRPIPAATAALQGDPLARTRAALSYEIRVLRKRTRELLEDHRRLREELSSLHRASDNIRRDARRIVARAQVAGGSK